VKPQTVVWGIARCNSRGAHLKPNTWIKTLHYYAATGTAHLSGGAGVSCEVVDWQIVRLASAQSVHAGEQRFQVNGVRAVKIVLCTLLPRLCGMHTSA
jgi:hypothetical protein